MVDLIPMLTIDIGIDPELQQFGGLLLTWHGIFTAVGIAAGVWVALLVGRRLGFIDDDVYSVALVAIPGGIIGARALYVAERWGTGGLDNVVDIFRVNEGGISIYGAIVGGLVAGIAYVWFRKLPMLRGLDGASFGLILGMGIGRIGDLINGEHFAKPSSLPWAVRYTNIDSPSFLNHPDCGFGRVLGQSVSDLCAQHPAVGYEMIGDLLIFGALFLILRVVRKEGVVFFAMLLLYSLMRFGVSELRIDSREVIAGLSVPQVTALCLIPIALLGLAYSWWRGKEEALGAPAPQAFAATGPPVR